MKKILTGILLLISFSALSQTTPWSNSPAVTPQTRSFSGAKQIRWLWGSNNLYSLDDSLAKYLPKRDSTANDGYLTHGYFNKYGLKWADTTSKIATQYYVAHFPHIFYGLQTFKGDIVVDSSSVGLYNNSDNKGYFAFNTTNSNVGAVLPNKVFVTDGTNTTRVEAGLININNTVGQTYLSANLHSGSNNSIQFPDRSGVLSIQGDTTGTGIGNVYTKAQTDSIAALKVNKTIHTYNVNDYGIYSGASDNTTALQTLINTVVAAGGGTIFFPYATSTYKIGGALNGTTNSQLYIPSDTVGTSHIPLEFRGETAPSMIDFGQAPLPRSTQGQIIESTLLASTGSIIASMPGISYGGTFNNVSVRMVNMEFRTPTISGGVDIAGRMTAIDMSQCFEFTFDYLKVSTTSTIWNSIQPSATYKTVGVKMQAINNLYQSGNGTLLTQGYYYGIVLGEHTVINRYIGIGDYTAIQTSNGYHDATILRANLECNKINIEQNGRQNLNIYDYNTEHCYTIAGGVTSEWYYFGYDIINPTSTIGLVTLGNINVVKSSVGQINEFLTDANAVYNIDHAYRTSALSNIVNQSWSTGYYNFTPSTANTSQFLYLPAKGNPTGYGGGLQVLSDSTIGHQFILTHGGTSTGAAHSNNKFLLTAGAGAGINADPFVIRVGPGSFTSTSARDLISLFPATQHIVIGNTNTDAIDGIYDAQFIGANIGLTGLTAIGTATEKVAINSNSLNLNMNPNGQIYNTAGFGYNIMHTSSTTNTSDFTSIVAYNTASTSGTPSVASTPLSWNAAGNVTIGGSSNTTAKLKILAGNATTAALQFSAGTSQTSMAAGSFDWQTTQLRFAHAAGAPRILTMTDNASSAGKIVVATGTDATYLTVTGAQGVVPTFSGSSAQIGLGAITPTSINTTHLPANIHQTPAGAVTDSVAVKLAATMKLGAVPVSNFLLTNATRTTNKLFGTGSGTTFAEITLGTNLSFSGTTLNVATSNQDHTIFTPTTGSTVSLVNNQYNIINPAGAILALTVTLPSSPANKDFVRIKFTQAVTTVTYSGGTVADGITSPIAGGYVIFTYDSGTTTWY